MAIELLAIDEYNRSQAVARFAKTWRWSDVMGKRVHGYKLLFSENADFGDRTFFSELPVGSGVGIPHTYTWQINPYFS